MPSVQKHSGALKIFRRDLGYIHVRKAPNYRQTKRNKDPRKHNINLKNALKSESTNTITRNRHQREQRIQKRTDKKPTPRESSTLRLNFIKQRWKSTIKGYVIYTLHILTHILYSKRQQNQQSQAQTESPKTRKMLGTTKTRKRKND